MPRPLNRTERRLYERLHEALPAGEAIQAAVVAFTGPRPGAEGLASVLGVLGVLFTRGRRRLYGVAITDQGVVRIPLDGRRKPVGTVGRHRLDELGPIEHTGLELWLELSGGRYWVEGVWGTELLKMRRLLEQSA